MGGLCLTQFAFVLPIFGLVCALMNRVAASPTQNNLKYVCKNSQRKTILEKDLMNIKFPIHERFFSLPPNILRTDFHAPHFMCD